MSDFQAILLLKNILGWLERKKKKAICVLALCHGNYQSCWEKQAVVYIYLPKRTETASLFTSFISEDQYFHEKLGKNL